jgi:hypothetical protein
MSVKQRVLGWVERRLGRFYEGPDVPLRYAEQAELFSRMNPAASWEIWKDYAITLAEAAYRDGFVRGLEHEARHGTEPAPDPVLACRHGWSVAQDAQAARRLREGDPADPWAGLPPEHRQEVIRGLAIASGLEPGPVSPRNPGSGDAQG